MHCHRNASNLNQQIPNRIPRKLGAQLWIVLGILTPCCAYLLIGILIYQPKQEYWVLPLSVFFSVVGPFRIYVAQAGYQIGYDAARLYQRNWGWSWRTLRRFSVHSMAYDEIASMHGRFIDRGYYKKSFYPFDFVEIRSRNKNVLDIEVYPIYLKHPHDKDLLTAIYKHRPELFPKDVIAYMHSPRAM